ncbi:hypothetical protein D9757_006863 [Collybiopsis confluens]|uniref:Uncharacterized protein n=1 Tax=Collybiopsis confluens TaxID=2823264 RepID=A0A8H5HQC2_9AGAR|nr:hypothetical protein D9757_006863 [Collybiopsis confluens]
MNTGHGFPPIPLRANPAALLRRRRSSRRSHPYDRLPVSRTYLVPQYKPLQQDAQYPSYQLQGLVSGAAGNAGSVLPVSFSAQKHLEAQALFAFETIGPVVEALSAFLTSARSLLTAASPLLDVTSKQPADSGSNGWGKLPATSTTGSLPNSAIPPISSRKRKVNPTTPIPVSSSASDLTSVSILVAPRAQIQENATENPASLTAPTIKKQKVSRKRIKHLSGHEEPNKSSTSTTGKTKANSKPLPNKPSVSLARARTPSIRDRSTVPVPVDNIVTSINNISKLKVSAAAVDPKDSIITRKVRAPATPNVHTPVSKASPARPARLVGPMSPGTMMVLMDPILMDWCFDEEAIERLVKAAGV